MDEVCKMFDKIIIFGIGVQGKKAYELLAKTHRIICFADNNIKYDGTAYKGIPIIFSEKLPQYCDEDTTVIVATIYHYDICKQLEKMRIVSYEIMIDGHIYKGHRNEKTRCTRCVMSNEADDFICFDDKGVCNYCTAALNNINNAYFPNDVGRKKLEQLLSRVKQENKGNKYDCIMGISGGLDSSYLAYLGYTWGLRVLAVHIDDGYDTEVTETNIRKLITATGFDYEVIRPDTEQFNDLIRAYMRAGVPNLAVPQDNILFAFLYKKMRECHVKYFFSGGNFALECILQKGNTHSAWDKTNILDIHKKFGTKGIDKLEFLSREQMRIDQVELGIESLRPLDLLEYNYEKALKELKEFCGFEYYGSKHLENALTAFVQLYWLPKKFGVDKRSSHLSSMIVSGQMSREKALKVLEQQMCDERELMNVVELMKQKLKISDNEFDRIIEEPSHKHEEYEIEKE